MPKAPGPASLWAHLQLKSRSFKPGCNLRRRPSAPSPGLGRASFCRSQVPGETRDLSRPPVATKAASAPGRPGPAACRSGPAGDWGWVYEPSRPPPSQQRERKKQSGSQWPVARAGHKPLAPPCEPIIALVNRWLLPGDYRSALSMSAMRSSTDSRPIDSRMTSSPAPHALRCSAVSCARRHNAVASWRAMPGTARRTPCDVCVVRCMYGY